MRTPVKDVMTTDVVAIAEDTSFKTIVETMRRAHVASVPVLDSAGQVRGVVSESDLLLKETDPDAAEEFHLSPARRREQRKAEAATAARLMTSPPVTIAETATVEDAAAAMRRHRVGRLPVIDEPTGRLVGIIGRADVLAVYGRPDEDIRRDVHDEVVTAEFGLDRGRIDVTVEDGQVTLVGSVPRRSQIPVLLHSVRHVEGVVSARARLSYDADDTYVGAVPAM